MTNPAREALTRAVNAAIARGAVIIVEQPTREARIAAKLARCEEMARAQRDRSREIGNHMPWMDYEISESLNIMAKSRGSLRLRDSYILNLNA